MSSNNPNAWLGLLKWSLAYTDGTKDSEPSKMSEEDRAFLEKVMTEGIIDEGERMKFILAELVVLLEPFEIMSSKSEEDHGSSEAKVPDESKMNQTIEYLQELRDIVEQIDYAQAFCALNGIPFLLGAAQCYSLPANIREWCIGILSTISQNNPKVQQILIEKHEAVRSLAEVYFTEWMNKPSTDEHFNTRSKIVQAINSIIRGHKSAEETFCNDELGRKMIEYGLGHISSSSSQKQENCILLLVPLNLRRKALFFLRVLVTSDFSTDTRVSLFHPCLRQCINLLSDEDDFIRQTVLEMLADLFQKKLGFSCFVELQNEIASKCIPAISELRKLKGEGLEYKQNELDLWEELLMHVAKFDKSATKSAAVTGESSSTAEPLLLTQS